MKHINTACFSAFLRKIALLLVLVPALNFAYGQCPVPFPKGDIDSTLRNVPRSTVVTHNDITYYGSGIPVSGDSLSIALYPSHGTLVILNDSIIQYTPNPGYVGTDFYVYTICNSCGNCSQASVSIEVKDYCPAPVANDDHYTVYNNVTSQLAVTSNDQNIAGGLLVLNVIRNPRHGNFAVSGTVISYTGNSGFTGLDTLVYTLKDTCPGANMDTATVYLTVITCQPVVAVKDTYSVQQQSTVTGNVTSNDIHVTGFGNTTITLLNGTKFGSTATLSGTTITYTAGINGFGLDSIKYLICTDCGCDSAYAIFHVTQKPCAKPIAVFDNIYAGYSPSCTNIYNITANDTIPINGGTLTVTLLGAPTFGTASIVNGLLHYTCTDSTRIGQTALVHYSICNACYCDTSFVNINITGYPCNGINPIIGPDTAEVCRNYPVVINVTANDYSPQSYPVTVSVITGQGAHGTATIVNGNNIRYTPNANFTGNDFFVYKACDNGTPSLCNIGRVGVYVAPCNAAPVILSGGNPADTIRLAVREDSTIQYCFSVATTDSPQIYIAHIGSSIDTIRGTLNTPSTTPPCISITPPTNSRAGQSFPVVICSETPVCDTVIVVVSVIPVDTRPVAHNDSISYNWGTPCSGTNVLRNDYDVDPGDIITISTFDATTASGGHISQSSDSVLCYTADSSFVGLDTFSYTICDTSHLCTSALVVVYVPLQARNDDAVTQQDSAVVIHVLANDTRSSNEYLRLCSTPLHGTVALDSSTVVYTPNHDYPIDPISTDTASYIGSDSFCYTLCHVQGTDTSCASAEVYVLVLPKAKFNIPQGISPNGDGVNDKFVIASDNEFPQSQLLVYNRYGDEVWRNDGDGYQNDFDGNWKKNGQPLPDGSYWYIFKFNDGRTHDRMGYIVIQR